jgi:hypothetical protein
MASDGLCWLCLCLIASEKFLPLSAEQMGALETGAVPGGSSTRRVTDLVSGALSLGRVAAVCEDVLAQHGALASPSLMELAASLYLQLLRELPALVRDWWSHKLPSRGVGASLAKFTEAYCSPKLLRDEIDGIVSAIGATDESFKVRGHER